MSLFDPICGLLSTYKSTFCTFNIDDIDDISSLDTIVHAIDSIVSESSDDEEQYDLTTTDHPEICMFPDVFIPNLPFRKKNQHILTDDNSGFFDTYPPVFLEPTCSSSSSSSSPLSPTTSAYCNPIIDPSVLVFSVSHDGRIIGRDINDISHNISNPAISHPVVALEPIPEIEKELAIMLKNKFFIDIYEELDIITLRSQYIRQIYLNINVLMSYHIQLYRLYQDCPILLRNPKYFIDSDAYCNSFYQAKFAFDTYIVLYIMLRRFNQDIEDIYVKKPVKISQFIAGINEKINVLISNIKRISWCFSAFTTHPDMILKFFIEPFSKSTQRLHTSQFSTLLSFLNKNIDHHIYSDFLQHIRYSEQTLDMRSHIFYCYFK